MNLNSQCSSYLVLMSRVLIGIYFFLPGVFKFLTWDQHVLLMEKHGIIFIPVLLACAGALEILAAIAIMVNRYTALLSLILFSLVWAINFSLHDFWNYSGVEGVHEQQNFLKNMAVSGGLLALSAFYFQKNTRVESTP